MRQSLPPGLCPVCTKANTRARIWAEVIAADEDATPPVSVGKRADITAFEADCFWGWAVAMTLKETGVRIEELLELTQNVMTTTIYTQPAWRMYCRKSWSTTPDLLGRRRESSQSTMMRRCANCWDWANDGWNYHSGSPAGGTGRRGRNISARRSCGCRPTALSSLQPIRQCPGELLTPEY